METTMEQNILDVTVLEPKQKHPTIFVRFDALAEGESLTIHNDHDPKPLYYQLLGERGNIFTWEYLEEGPQLWRVKISKRKLDEGEETLGELAVKDLRKAEVFKKFGLDFCCGGKKTIKEACAEKGIDVTRVEKELQQAEKQYTNRPIPYTDWSLDFLADYIVNTHHSYVKKALPNLNTYAKKVKEVHQADHSELVRIHQLVEEVTAEMSSHMIKEEQILFPYIKNLVAKQKGTATPQDAAFGSVQAPINMMEAEHEWVGKSMAEIRTLTNQYSLPADACASYSLLYNLLEEFEQDLFLHIHLENNILFPKALTMEKNK